MVRPDETGSARDWGLTFGSMPTGPRNCLTDVDGVEVGHYTMADGDVQTGFTVVRPHVGNLFRHASPAGHTVFNGFGKSAGLIQIEELGVLETPIVLTNTFSVAAGLQGLLDYALTESPEIGTDSGTINSVVMECNDQYLNAIRKRVLRAEDVSAALADCGREFRQGAVGAGRGMSCFGFKGGIGSSSRRIQCGSSSFMLGVLVLSNFGAPEWLQYQGISLGDLLESGEKRPEKGSVIIIAAVDAPCDSRQLKRLTARASMGLARVGSYMGHGSGDIALAFSTAQTIPHNADSPTRSGEQFNELYMDNLFQGMVWAVEEAVWNSMTHAETVEGFRGHKRIGIGWYRDEIIRRCTK